MRSTGSKNKGVSCKVVFTGASSDNGLMTVCMATGRLCAGYWPDKSQTGITDVVVPVFLREFTESLARNLACGMNSHAEQLFYRKFAASLPVHRIIGAMISRKATLLFFTFYIMQIHLY